MFSPSELFQKRKCILDKIFPPSPHQTNSETLKYLTGSILTVFNLYNINFCSILTVFKLYNINFSKNNFYFYFYVYECVDYMCVCVVFVCLIFGAARRGCQSPRNGSYRQFWALMWVLEIKCESSEENGCKVTESLLITNKLLPSWDDLRCCIIWWSTAGSQKLTIWHHIR